MNFRRKAKLLLLLVFNLYYVILGASANEPGFADEQVPTHVIHKQLSDVTNDSLGVENLLSHGRHYETVDFDTALYYYNEAIRIAQTNNWPELHAKALINVGFAYRYGMNSELSIDYLIKGLAIYEELNNKDQQLDCYYNLGTFYGYFERYAKSIENFNQAVTLGIELNNKTRLAATYNNLGLMYHYTGQYHKANEYHYKSLEIKESIGDKSIGLTLLNIGLNYAQQEDFERSLEQYNKALLLFQKSEKKTSIALAFKNIGDLYSTQNLFDSAIQYYNKAYVIYQEQQDLIAIARHHMVMGVIEQKQGNYNAASNRYDEALADLPENGSRRLRFAIYSNIADLALILADSLSSNYLQTALEYGKEMLKIASEIGSISMKATTYDVLFQTYSRMDYKNEALFYANKVIVAKDSLNSKQKQKTISDIQIKYETERKELEIELLNSQNKLITTSLDRSQMVRKNQSLLIYFLMGGFLLIGVFVLIIFRFYRKSKQANKELLSKNKIIIKQKEEKELLLKEMHHRIKNNLQLISSLFELQLRSSKDAAVNEALIDSLHRVGSIALIHQVLYQYEDDRKISIETFVQELVKQIVSSFQNNQTIDYRLVIPSSIKFDMQTTIPLGLIIAELITNSFKYAFKKNTGGAFTIKLEQGVNDSFFLEVGDNGKGLPEDYNFNSAKTLGHRLIGRLAKQLGGKLKYNYSDGARFILSFTIEKRN